MVFKKPYAFLIKQFRTIHIILVFLSVFILNKTSSIYTYFADYTRNGYTGIIEKNMASKFINGQLFFIVILTMGILTAIAVLLSYKKKKEKMYFITIGYYFILMIFYMFYISVFNELENNVISASSALVYKDVSLIFYLPQFLIVMFYSVRALGFDVKKFNFNLDLKEMDLETEDNEEVELNIEFESYKAKRSTRRFLREMKYYIHENLIFFIIIVGTLFFTFSYNILSNLSFFSNYNYSMKETFSYKNLDITVDNVIVTNVDLGGNEILDGKYFIVASIIIENNNDYAIDIDINDFRILYNDVMLLPATVYANKFTDYGSTMTFSNMKKNSSTTYVISYMVEEKDLTNKFSMRLYTENYVKNGITYPIYSIIPITAETLKFSSDPNTTKVEGLQNYINSNIKESSLTINDFAIGNVFYYPYEMCYNAICTEYQRSIYIDYSVANHKNKTILKLDADLVLDETTLYYKNNKNYINFFDNFVQVKYKVGDEEVTETVKGITTTTNDGCYYLLISEKAKSSESLSLIVTIRNREYTYKLK
ncbi:MAG: hypothetical protein R3Y13_04930 [bacterium]